MRDQAENLRLKLQAQTNNSPNAKTIAVVSGKGGVGKSNFSLNFALSLIQLNQQVLLIDMDIGMGNLDILMGKAPQHTIVDYLMNDLNLHEIVMEGHEGIHYIAGGTGLSQLVKFDEDKLKKFTQELQILLEKYDYVIFDMGAGLSDDSLRILLSVHEVFVVTTPEPTAITDAYATMKFIHLKDSSLPMFLIVNKALNEKEGKETFNRLSTVMSKFLGREVNLLSNLPDDRTIHQAVKSQTPFLIFNPKSQASLAIKTLTERYKSEAYQNYETSASFSFVSKLKKFLFER